MPGHYGKKMMGAAKGAAKGKMAKRDAMMELGIMPAPKGMKKPMKKVAKKK